MKRLYGVTVAMITPMDEEDRIIEESLIRYVDFLIEKGINCLYPLGTTGEMLLLDIEERKMVSEIIVGQAGGRVPVFIHAGAMKTKDAIELAQHAHKIGADGIGAVTPSFFSVNDRELEEYYLSISNSVPEDFPIYMYSIPQFAANDISLDAAEEIAKKAPNIIGIKYSCADIIRTYKYLQLNDGRFSVLSGVDGMFNAMLALGCDGVVSGSAGVFPEPFVALYRAFIAGDILEAQKIQRAVHKLSEIMLYGSNMSYYKAGLKMRGVDAGHMRKPLLDLTVEQYAQLESLLAEYLSIYGTA